MTEYQAFPSFLIVFMHNRIIQKMSKNRRNRTINHLIMVTREPGLWSKKRAVRHKTVTCKTDATKTSNQTKTSGKALKQTSRRVKTALKRHIDKTYILTGCKSYIYVV